MTKRSQGRARRRASSVRASSDGSGRRGTSTARMSTPFGDLQNAEAGENDHHDVSTKLGVPCCGRMNLSILESCHIFGHEDAKPRRSPSMYFFVRSSCLRVFFVVALRRSHFVVWKLDEDRHRYA